MSDVIGLVGYIGSGKDTVYSLLNERLGGDYNNFKFAGKLKEFCCAVFDIEPSVMESQEKKKTLHKVVYKNEDEFVDKFIDSCHSLEIYHTETISRLCTRTLLLLKKHGDSSNLIIEQTPRKILQVIGTDVFREVCGENFWVDQLKSDEKVIATDVRFPNEAQRIKDLGGILVRVKSINDNVDNHESEQHISTIECDYEILNKKDGMSNLLLKVDELSINILHSVKG